MMQNKKIKYIFIIIFLIALLSAVFFAWNKTADNAYVAKIGSYEVSLSEYMVYFREQQLNFEKIGGLDIWETKIYGEPTFSIAKQYALDSLTYIKIMSIEAKKDNVSLTEEEIKEYTDIALQYYNDLTVNDKRYIDYDTALTAIKETALVQKYREFLLKKSIKEGEAFEEYFHDYLISHMADLDISVEYVMLPEKSISKEDALVIADEGKGDGNFSDAIKAHADVEVYTGNLNEINIPDSDKLNILYLDLLSVYPPIMNNGEIYIIKLMNAPDMESLKSDVKTSQQKEAEEFIDSKYQRLLNNTEIVKISSIWDKIELIEKDYN